MHLLQSRSKAIQSVMSVFTEKQQEEFEGWLAEKENLSGVEDNLIYGHPYYILHVNNDLFKDSPKYKNIQSEIVEILDELQSAYISGRTAYYTRGFLIFVLDQKRRGANQTLVMISEQILTGLLDSKHAPEHFTPSEVRVLAQLISDPEIKHAALVDKVSVSTKETHYKSAARKIGGRKRIGVIANLTAQLLLEVTIASRPYEHAPDKSFNEYREKYLPRRINVLTLSNPSSDLHWILDMGPKPGKVVIVLHPMILPDIRDQDIDLLYKLNLRLVWPLRHGALTPYDSMLSAGDQLEHAIEGIELAKQHFCDGPFILAALVTSSWYAVRYVERFPRNVSSMFFAAACYSEQRKSHASRQFGEGLISLATHHQRTVDLFLKFAKQHFSKGDRLRLLLQNIFSGSVSDLAILEQERNRPGFNKRYYFALSNSLNSVKHDLFQQSDMGWERLTSQDIPMHFVHGEDDAVDSLDSIKSLVARIPTASLSVLPSCGQLMYYSHFEALARIIGKLG